MSGMAARVFFPNHADLHWIKNKTVAVIGYGNQGPALALNLRSRGVTVVIGSRQDASLDKALADGFTVQPIAEAAAQGDFVMRLIPDEVLPGILEKQIAPNLKSGVGLSFASGYTVAYTW